MSWTPALRIARRGVKRDLGRAALVVALVGVPIGAATMVDVLARTLSNPARDAERDMGSADASVFGDSDFAALLPKGSRVVYAPTSRMVGIARSGGTVRMADPTGPSLPGTGHFVVQGDHRAALVSADARDSMHRQAATVASGKAPANAQQVMVTQPLADRLKLHVGDKIQSSHGPLTDHRHRRLAVLPELRAGRRAPAGCGRTRICGSSRCRSRPTPRRSGRRSDSTASTCSRAASAAASPARTSSRRRS